MKRKPTTAAAKCVACRRFVVVAIFDVAIFNGLSTNGLPTRRDCTRCGHTRSVTPFDYKLAGKKTGPSARSSQRAISRTPRSVEIVRPSNGEVRPGDAARKSAARAVERDLVVPAIHDAARRAACEADDAEWLRVYCAEVFYNPFSAHQQRIIADCREALLYGTQKCKAAPRGDGKSSIVKYLALKHALCRQVRFPLIVAATSTKAKKTLGSLKRRLAARAQSALAEDYPLECTVARYVNPWPSRARNVTANGQRSIHVEWGADWFVIPTWEDEEPLGPILLSLGITSDELQGCNIFDQRPDFVMLDDLDSRDSLASEDGVVAGKIEETVDKAIAGLGGQGQRLGKFMLCTITSRESAAYKYSDAAQKPSWSGERIPAIIAWPDRADLWATYTELRTHGKKTMGETGQPVDVFGRKAHQHYLENRDAMDAGAVLSNPFNFESSLLPDGSQKQVSALQRCCDFIADEGMPSFMTEHQSDPPEDLGSIESGINAQMIQRQVSGIEQGVIPDGCSILVQGVDIGKWWFHWVVRAFRPDGTGFTIDYGRQNVYDTKFKSDEGLDRAIHREVLRRMAEFREMPYAQQIRDSLTLVDSGYRTESVYAACAEIGMGVMPVKGIGYSAGCAEQGRFVDVMTSTRDKMPVCDGVFLSTLRLPPLPAFYLVCASADQWKAWEHDRWQTARDKPGCMFLYGQPSDRPEYLSPDERAHGHYAHHICAEVELEEVHKGALRRRWKSNNKENHWLDASYYADVAAAIKGARVLGDGRPLPVEPKRPLVISSGRQFQAGARW